jgi:methionine synthase II (cobalamin-independent)
VNIFAHHNQGIAPEAELDRAKDDALRGIVAKQAAVGLPVVTDGELRPRTFQESFCSVSGFEVAAATQSFSYTVMRFARVDVKVGNTSE